MNRKSGGRNGIIELFRFVFSLVVVMVHTHGLRPIDITAYPFSGGCTAVEFFLIVSGYFAVSNSWKTATLNDPVKAAVAYTARSFKKVFPIVVVSVTIHYVAGYCMQEVDTQDLLYAVYELLLLPQSGIYKTFLNIPLWYLSAYMICLPLFVYLANKGKGFFVHIGSVIAPLLIYGFICRVNVDMDIWSFDNGIMFIGLFRVFAGLCMGLNCYRLSEKLCSIAWRDPVQKAWPIIAVILLLSVIGYQAVFAFTYADYFLILIMTVSLAILFCGRFGYGKGNPVFLFLGRWSVSIYCSHWLVRDIVPKTFPDKEYYELLPPYLIAVLLYSLFVWFLSGVLVKGVEAVKGRVLCYDPTI